MKYNKVILVFGLFLTFPSLVWSQKKILTEKVEVTKSYIPNIGKALKRDIRPQVEDIMQIDIPKLRYTISYKPERPNVMINSLDAPSYRLTTNEPLYNGYGDVALGVPFMSRLNLSYTSTELRNTIYGASISHNGFWGKIKDANGLLRSGSNTDNDLSLYFEYQKANLKTKISASQRYDAFDRYGFNGSKIDNEKQYFMKTSANAEIGTSFDDLNKFNVNLGASVNIISDKYSYGESIYQIGLLMSKGFSNINSRLEARIEYMSDIPSRRFNLFQIYGEKPIERPTPEPGDILDENVKYSPTGLLSIAPRYLFNYRGLDIDLGVNMSFDFNGDKNNYKQGVSNILPQLELSYSFAKGVFRPFIKVDGKYIVNNYFSMTEQNPYIVQGLTAPNTVLRRYMVGFDGTIKSSFSYKAYIGLRQSRDLLMYVNVASGNVFSVLRGDFDNTEFGVELGYVLNNLLSFNMKATYIDYNNTGALTDNIAFGYAPFTARFMINCFPTKSLTLSLGGELQSSRTFGSIINEELVVNKVGSVFDLSLMGEYKITDRVSVLLRGANLLNQKLYQYNNYRGVGLNVMAGVSLKF